MFRDTASEYAIDDRLRPRLTERRLALLDCLRGRDVPLSDLAADLARATGAAGVERLQVRLHHVDLPVLEDLGLLEYDAESRTVSAVDGDGARGRQAPPLS